MRAIGLLSPDHREIIMLRHFQGMSYREIADVVGCSIGTVMSRLHYARKKLRNMLSVYVEAGEAVGGEAGGDE